MRARNDYKQSRDESLGNFVHRSGSCFCRCLRYGRSDLMTTLAAVFGGYSMPCGHANAREKDFEECLTRIEPCNQCLSHSLVMDIGGMADDQEKPGKTLKERI